MRTRDQRYAISVYRQAQAVKVDFAKDYRKYGVMCHKLPILIHTAGLAQALAFVESRNKDIYKRFLGDITLTLKESHDGNDSATLPEGVQKSIVQQAREAELNDYMRLTWQVMAALVWYKRFAQSILGVDVSETAEPEDE